MMPPSFFYDSMSNTHCQKSQRMFITANTLYSNLQSIGYRVDQISKYCVGEKRQLIDHILRDDTTEDSIVVWEHHEIIQIIREFGISIDTWRNHFIDEYSLVFQIHVESRILHYDCFDFQHQQQPCPKSIDLWLTHFDKIGKLQNYKTSGSIRIRNSMFVLASIILVSVIGLVYAIYKYRQMVRRSGYTIIV